ncbi:hypothetical protein U1Q18_042254 [Sarracenia purpurea var. burkii]
MSENGVKEQLQRVVFTCNGDCLSPFVSVLERGSLSSRTTSARILESIAFDADSLRAITKKQGLLFGLHRLLDSETDSKAIEAGLSCLIAVTTSRENPFWFEHGTFSYREGSEAARDGFDVLGGTGGDLRRRELRGGDREEIDEGVERGDGARRRRALERVLFVPRSDGPGSSDEKQRYDEGTVGDAERLYGGCEADVP